MTNVTAHFPKMECKFAHGHTTLSTVPTPNCLLSSNSMEPQEKDSIQKLNSWNSASSIPMVLGSTSLRSQTPRRKRTCETHKVPLGFTIRRPDKSAQHQVIPCGS